jgi:hypothetical protein
VLRELRPELPGEDFGWGHNGGGPLRAAGAILSDALGLKPTIALAGAFTWDFLVACPDEFMIRRSAVLRWVRGQFADLGVSDLPTVLRELPPASHDDYRPVHKELAWDNRQRGRQSVADLLRD